MIATAFRVLAYVLMLLGLVHSLLTPLFYDTFSADAVWFAGTGLALLFLGALNLAAALSADQMVLTLCVVANVVGTVLGVLILLTVPEIQAVVALVVFVAITALSVLMRFTPAAGTY